MKNAPQYITDGAGKKLSVILPVKDYEKMVSDLEELEDIRTYDAVKSRKEESIPFEEYIKMRKKKKDA